MLQCLSLLGTAVPYYTDRLFQISEEIGIDSRCKEHLEQYSNFWKNKIRIEKFKELYPDGKSN